MIVNEMKAKYEKAMKYYYGDHGYAKNKKKAFELLLPLASSGYIDAMAQVGRMYFKGKGTKCNYEKALEWYLKAAIAGHTEAQKMSAMMYSHGIGTKKDVKKASELYEKAALSEDEEAMYQLGVYYYLNEHLYEKSIYWLKRAIDHQYTDAKRMLGFVYQDMKNEESHYWFNQALNEYEKEAYNGNSESAYLAGELYLKGLGTKHDKDKAKQMFEIVLNDDQSSFSEQAKKKLELL